MDWDLDVSRDFVGVVLLGLTAAFGLAAFVLAWRGLGRKRPPWPRPAETTSSEIKSAVAKSQSVLAEATGDHAQKLAVANSELAEKAASLEDAVGSVYDSQGAERDASTGEGVFRHLLFSLLAALVSFEILTFSVNSEGGATSTPEPTPAPMTTSTEPSG